MTCGFFCGFFSMGNLFPGRFVTFFFFSPWWVPQFAPGHWVSTLEGKSLGFVVSDSWLLFSFSRKFFVEKSCRQWLFLVPVKGGFGGIYFPIWQYIPLIVLALWGGLYATYQLTRIRRSSGSWAMERSCRRPFWLDWFATWKCCNCIVYVEILYMYIWLHLSIDFIVAFCCSIEAAWFVWISSDWT